ncbi:helix-hairpin-helix domain-containing protein [Thermosipho globiformans]|uniref:helix-hairpin-helix domain-containing protein n=1 Tax=Thermosipho globiformans TaxID=380685 RepID=UPI000F8C41DE|nr:Tex-like N-terminal domain-containing protein [Thermosipho globiformans]
MEKLISKKMNLKNWQVKNALLLLKENTIHFVARYRKDQTGGLNEEQLRKIQNLLHYYEKVEKEKKKILKALEKENKLTIELKKKIENSYDLDELEQIYLPYKKKKKSKADIAIENGLLELYNKLINNPESFEKEIPKYFSKTFDTKDKVIEGLKNIIAQNFSHDERIRKRLEFLMSEYGYLKCTKKVDYKTKYDAYENFFQKIKNLKGYSVLSINRGEKENILKVQIALDDKFKNEIFKLTKLDLKNEIILKGLEMGWKKLFDSIKKRIRNQLTQKAENRAIAIFSKNLKQLLLTPPLKDKRILAIDPGNKTGCKIAVLDENGKFLEKAIIFPTPPHNDIENSEKIVIELIKKFNLNLIVIGNGTASRETQKFIVNTIKKFNLDVKYIFANEAGASVYSVSKIAIEEFPDLDPTIRSAISIGRRVQDPLSEFVKIDPKSLGVGQYQHDVNQKRLKEELNNVTKDVVNMVGVNLNTASAKLLEYVSGITPSIAKKIVKYREKHGKFIERKQLLNIEGIGEKTFEQCAGFLRIIDGKNPLEKSRIHPEQYEIANKIISLNLDNIDIEKLSKELNVGILTLKDIINEIKNPGLDPRESMPKPKLFDDILTFEDLRIGLKLQGKVTNITDFGAFIDIGLKESAFLYKKLITRELNINDIVDIEIIDLDQQLRHIKVKLI